MSAVDTAHGRLALPAFLPDATRAVVRAAASDELAACGIDALMVNALHLADSPGVSLVRAAGGIRRFMGWRGIVASDSGGFQAWSLAAGPGRAGPGRPAGGARARMTDAGITIERPGHARARLLTPEKSIEQQLRLGAAIVFCLDACTHPGAPTELQRESVARTVDWARRCRVAFDRELERSAGAGRRGGRRDRPAHAREERTCPPDGPAESPAAPPLLFAVVQGGNERDLRRACIEALAGIGFDGYGFGGWPVAEGGELLETVSFVAGELPAASLMHGLGIGKPDTLVAAWRAGYRLFDCVIPTRDARHGRLFRFREDPAASALDGRAFYDEVAIADERFARRMRPLEPGCPCALCRSYPAAYLRHLFRIRDASAARLATLHNLTFYGRLMRALRERS
ncbi:MAG: tRNA-guanine transglycosylase [Candidatus Eisenbacteria bacterium]|uniref:tRNA-guanine transglycosylase n=1 Tax=Eiseniibacteriota bacterium TaxID=2212470 RepID=A0A937XC24_UNCEI|nr:tRNA-guanine transglycosylase [Candidatus Eisenbacteria bacterium]